MFDVKPGPVAGGQHFSCFKPGPLERSKCPPALSNAAVFLAPRISREICPQTGGSLGNPKIVSFSITSRTEIAV